MRKLAILGLIIFAIIVVLTTMAFFNVVGIRDIIYNGMQGTVFQPIHDFVVANWIAVGNMGFTYIVATSLGIGIIGGLFLVFIVYGLLWQKLIQGKLLHKVAPSPTEPMQRTLSTPLTPTQETIPPEKKEEP